MTLDEYITEAQATKSPFFFTPISEEYANKAALPVDILHGIIGVCTEVAEIFDALLVSDLEGNQLDLVNIDEEVGDILWYMALIFHKQQRGFLPYPFDKSNAVTKINSTVLWPTFAKISAIAGNMLDIAKKSLFYGKVPDLQKIDRLLDIMTFHLATYVSLRGKTFEDYALQNNAKLRTRYPEQFTKFAALNRDLNAERKTLENPNG